MPGRIQTLLFLQSMEVTIYGRVVICLIMWSVSDAFKTYYSVLPRGTYLPSLLFDFNARNKWFFGDRLIALEIKFNFGWVSFSPNPPQWLIPCWDSKWNFCMHYQCIAVVGLKKCHSESRLRKDAEKEDQAVLMGFRLEKSNGYMKHYFLFLLIFCILKPIICLYF